MGGDEKPWFSAEPYSQDALTAILVARSHHNNPAVGNKPQVRFLDRYLKALGCRAIVTEKKYTDRNFLEDHAAYYIRCFEPYSHVCTRLHFFKRDLDDAQLAAAIVGAADAQDDCEAARASSLQGDYLGFVVVKPLPLTIIGRTCLQPYGAADGRTRMFPAAKPQAVDLFGMKLEVTTLPFQEQDREVAACASSALWTLLHSTSRAFQHAMPSPVEITKAATAHAHVDGRTFPNGGGLNTLQIADAIRSVGLDPFVVSVSSVPRLLAPSEQYGEGAPRPATLEIAKATPEKALEMQQALKLAVMAYLRSGIACILLAQISDQDGAGTVLRGNHAVAITGYSLHADKKPEGYSQSGTLFTADRVDRLYVHDDQTGPFTRFSFADDNMLVASDFSAPDAGRRMAQPANIVVPLYHKIRIPLQQVMDLTLALDSAIQASREWFNFARRFEWDIQLLGLEELRKDVGASGLDAERKLALLTQPLPRFLWRVRAALPPKLAFDLLLDATDLLQGELVRELIVYDAEMCRRIGMMFEVSGDRLPETLVPTGRAFKALIAETALV